MKDENKCFFSISLENGITITGENPKKVLNFLYDMHSAFFELHNYYNKEQLNNLSNHMTNTMEQIANAIDTIRFNMKG